MARSEANARVRSCPRPGRAHRQQPERGDRQRLRPRGDPHGASRNRSQGCKRNGACSGRHPGDAERQPFQARVPKERKAESAIHAALFQVSVAEISEPIPQGQKYRANGDQQRTRRPVWPTAARRWRASWRRSFACWRLTQRACRARFRFSEATKSPEPPVVLIEVLRCRRDNVFRPEDFSMSEFNRIEVVAGIGHEDVSQPKMPPLPLSVAQPRTMQSWPPPR